LARPFDYAFIQRTFKEPGKRCDDVNLHFKLDATSQTNRFDLSGMLLSSLLIIQQAGDRRDNDSLID
jgi:hypothetical protein